MKNTWGILFQMMVQTQRILKTDKIKAEVPQHKLFKFLKPYTLENSIFRQQ